MAPTGTPGPRIIERNLTPSSHGHTLPARDAVLAVELSVVGGEDDQRGVELARVGELVEQAATPSSTYCSDSSAHR